MKILVINAGSSSLKYQIFDMKNESVIAKGNCEKIGLKGSFASYKANGNSITVERELNNHIEAINLVFELITSKENRVVKTLEEIDAIGHRIVHGSEIFKNSIIIDEKNLEILETLIPLAPLHMPANIAGVKASIKLMPNKPQIGVFDTAFHSSMPQKAFMYGLPMQAYTDWKIRRYGFHGSSHRFVSDECAKLMKKSIKDLKIITIHLGNGSSMAAVNGGISVDTTMGFTPLEGLVMGSRCGDLDASIVEYINTKTGWSFAEITNYLNKKSGMLGLNGVTSDSRENNVEIEKGNKGAKLFIDMLSYKIKKYIGAYAAAMGGVDALVFTGGIGENQDNVRQYCLEDLQFLGIELDIEKNKNLPRGTIEEISGKNSKVKIYRIPTDEELVIARDCIALIKK